MKMRISLPTSFQKQKQNSEERARERERERERERAGRRDGQTDEEWFPLPSSSPGRCVVDSVALRLLPFFLSVFSTSRESGKKKKTSYIEWNGYFRMEISSDLTV